MKELKKLTLVEEMAFDKLQKLDPDLYNLIIYEGDYQEVNSDDVPDSDNSDNPPQSQDASDASNGSQQPTDPGMDTTGENAQDIQNEKNSHDTMDPNVQQSEDAQNQQAIDNNNPEQLLMIELDATQDKIVQFNIFRSLSELRKNLDFAIDNINNNKITNNNIIEKLNYYKDLLEVLNELIFVLSPNTTYMIYASSQMEITQLLKEYLDDKERNTHEKTEKI